ncbi:hypothetical protein O6H91_02G044200 [Diphasiastrum complanatum]|uniref:Uncharacterized protein n=1 Tax=Diphasiastrum complanatum TaxID=34168 RepID=A0ACC2EF74_DIPCM|nr:hypothetical protein O6H91_02G044200 [Diphasiastrum complanatum]
MEMAVKTRIWHSSSVKMEARAAGNALSVFFAGPLLNSAPFHPLNLPKLEATGAFHCISSSSSSSSRSCSPNVSMFDISQAGAEEIMKSENEKPLNTKRLKEGTIIDHNEKACARSIAGDNIHIYGAQETMDSRNEKPLSMKQWKEGSIMDFDVKACAKSIADSNVRLDTAVLNKGAVRISPETDSELSMEKEGITQRGMSVSTPGLKTSKYYTGKSTSASIYYKEKSASASRYHEQKSTSVTPEDEMLPGNPDAFALRISKGIRAPRTLARSSSIDGRQNAKLHDIESCTEPIICEKGIEATPSEIEQAEDYLSNCFIKMRKDHDKETVLRRLLRERREASWVNPKPSGNSETDIANVGVFYKDTTSLSDIEENSRIHKDMVAFQRSLSSKRESVAKVLQDAMRASKIGPEYSKQVIASMPLFVDRILMKAVALKRKPTYAALSFSARARLIIDRSKVVEIVKWLKHNGITVPRVGFLVCQAGDQLDIIRPRVEWLKNIYVKGRDLGVVLSREPSILEQSEEELNNTVSFLEDSGIRKDWIGWVVSRSPGVLALSTDELHEKVMFLSELGMEKEQFGAMIFNFPALLVRFSKEEMQIKVEYLRRVGLESPTLGRIIATKPQLLACSIEEAWEPITKFLFYLGVNRTGIRRILAVQPSVFCLNLSENIAPKVRFLRAIGVREQEIGHLIMHFPAVLTYSLEKKIRPVVRFLLERAGVAEEKIGKVVAAEPKLIGCSLVMKLEVIVKYLLSRGIHTHQLGEMVANFPMLLKYNKEVLNPKYQYFKKVMQRPLEELISFPRYFSYALQTRIAPRHRISVEKGLRFNLRYMLACSDLEFQDRVESAEKSRATEASREEFAEFGEETCLTMDAKFQVPFL